MRAISENSFKKSYAALDATRSAANMETDFYTEVKAIRPLFGAADTEKYLQNGKRHIDNLTKPLGSLGQLEELALTLYCMEAQKNSLEPEKLCIDPGLLFTVAADHGVVAEGVSPCPQEITRQMLHNFLNEGAAINALCHNAGLDFFAVDAGVLGPDFTPHPLLIQAKIAQGSANMALGPALSREQCLRALLLGLELAERAAKEGCRCLASGEMGIGNTTPSSALYCAFLNLDPKIAVGPGAGLDSKLLGHKAAVIAQSLEVNRAVIEKGNALDILAALGGLEIAVMSGIMLGAARHHLPMLIDGFIAGAAFVSAWKIAPEVKDYCIFTHCSAETAHGHILKLLGQKPLLNLGLRLGEGTGAALGMNILRGAVHMFNDMASFAEANVSASAI
jgi:nicotinate-nucleotide--dimethylbenzimidazole phosphoribosyltransferase